MFKPYDWQAVDLEMLARNNYTGLLAIEPGGGKTPLALFAAEAAKAERTLIVAPGQTFNNPKKNWPATVRDILEQEVRPMGNSSKAHKNNIIEFELGYPGVYIATPQFTSRKTTDTSMWSGDMLIYDESHEGATAASQTQKRMSGFYPSDPEPLNRRFAHRLMLSGTPQRQSFQNFWSAMRFLWPELDEREQVAYANYYMWCNDRMTSEKVYTNQRDEDDKPKTATNYISESEPGRLVSEMPCVIIHKRRERCCDFHPNGFLETEEPVVINRVVDLTSKQVSAIHELEKHYMTYLEQNQLVTKLSITQQQRIRQICLGEPRVEYYLGVDAEGNPVEKSTLEYDDDCLSPFLDELMVILDEIGDEPAVVFLDAQRFAPIVVKRLQEAGITAAEYSGKTKADLNKFTKEYRVLVGVVSSIGTGTDGLADNCQNEVWLEVPVSLTKESQSTARLDRIGSKNQVTRYYIRDSLGYSQGRMDSNIEKRLRLNKSLRRVNGAK